MNPVEWLLYAAAWDVFGRKDADTRTLRAALRVVHFGDNLAGVP